MTARSAPLPDRILLIGAGNIAVEYVKALRSLGYAHIGILSRSLASAQKLAAAETLTEAHGGGEATLPNLLPQYDAFIVAVPADVLKNYAEIFAKAKIDRVLIEKPCFLYSDELANFIRRYPKWGGRVVLNRLYYPSVEKMREVIAGEGVSSVEFSFTEWPHRIDPAKFSPLELSRWGLSNCIHVISAVFDLIGLPRSLEAAQYGKDVIAWHKSGSIYHGHGVSEKNVPFVYHADWNTAGRWSMTIRTPRGSYSLCPIEGIDFTARGTVKSETLMAPWSEPVKCGFAPMLEDWLAGASRLDMATLLTHIKAVEQVFGYAPSA